MKKKLFIIAMIITIIGIIIVAVKGFNVNLKYRAHKAINIPIGTEFNIEDINAITNDVFADEKFQLEKAGLYNDEVIINVSDVSDEQIENLTKKINEKYNIKQNITILVGQENNEEQSEEQSEEQTETYNVEDIEAIAKEVFEKDDVKVEKSEEDENYVVIESELITEEKLEELNNKINEKYGLQNTTSSIGVSQIVTINEYGRVRLTDMAKQYVIYISIATIIVLVYFAIRFRKLGSTKVLAKSIVLLVLAEIFYMAIIAITRYPIDKLAILAVIAIYLIVMTYLSNSFIKQTSEK